MLYHHVCPRLSHGSEFHKKKKENMKEQCHIDNIEDAEFIIDNMEQLPEIDDDTLATLALM